jgi:catechol-2,3-dioxygenase
MTRPPFAVDAIDHVLLLVAGMDESLEFYEGVLGAVVEARLPKNAMAELRVAGRSLCLYVRDPSGNQIELILPASS